MKAKIIWHNTGDEIIFVPCDCELFEYWVSGLHQATYNDFSLTESDFCFVSTEKLKISLERCKTYATRIPFLISNWDGDCLDQHYLNVLHKEWVETSKAYPRLIQLLKQLGIEQEWRDINFYIHEIEGNFKFKFANYISDPWQLPNPYGNKILGFTTANFSLGFDNLGRSSYNKFLCRDENVDDSDTNDRSMLSGLVKISLDKPLTWQPPGEYIQWCKEKNWPVIGDSLPLGNIENLDENLTDIRHVLVRNIYEQNGTFSFEICS